MAYYPSDNVILIVTIICFIAGGLYLPSLVGVSSIPSITSNTTLASGIDFVAGGAAGVLLYKLFLSVYASFIK